MPGREEAAPVSAVAIALVGGRLGWILPRSVGETVDACNMVISGWAFPAGGGGGGGEAGEARVLTAQLIVTLVVRLIALLQALQGQDEQVEGVGMIALEHVDGETLDHAAFDASDRGEGLVVVAATTTITTITATITTITTITATITTITAITAITATITTTIATITTTAVTTAVTATATVPASRGDTGRLRIIARAGGVAVAGRTA